jgi:predicted kinase
MSRNNNKIQGNNNGNKHPGTKFTTQGSLTNLVPKPALVINQQSQQIQSNQSITQNKQKPKLLILRGAPGSGKTTLAKTLFSNWKIVSTNDYFTKPDGSFHFEPNNLQTAHNNCLDKTKIFLKEGHNVVVDNTFRTLAELSRYSELQQIADVRIYRVISQFNSIHNVPDDIMTRNLKEYEKCPIEKEVKLDLINKKLIFCEKDGYESPLLKIQNWPINNIGNNSINIKNKIIQVSCDKFEIGINRKFNYETKVNVSYYQKPGGINVLSSIEVAMNK